MRFVGATILLCAASAAATSHIGIYARNVLTLAVIPVGSLDYDLPASKVEFTPEVGHIEPGSYCLGSKDSVESDCFAYIETEGQLAGEFIVFVDEDDVAGLSFIKGKAGLQLRVEKVSSGPVPNLEPLQGQQQAKAPVTQKVTRKRVVENEDGEKVEIEEEIEEIVPVDERSWVQKNWMYIVLPLVLVLLLSPEDKAEEK